LRFLMSNKQKIFLTVYLSLLGASAIFLVLAPLSNVQKLMAVGGGLPLFHDGKLIGGIGVSGGSHEQDRQAASTAMGSLGFEIACA
jgi:uncharacterized protein GlcG (DUF336 family)